MLNEFDQKGQSDANAAQPEINTNINKNDLEPPLKQVEVGWPMFEKLG